MEECQSYKFLRVEHSQELTLLWSRLRLLAANVLQQDYSRHFRRCPRSRNYKAEAQSSLGASVQCRLHKPERQPWRVSNWGRFFSGCRKTLKEPSRCVFKRVSRPGCCQSRFARLSTGPCLFGEKLWAEMGLCNSISIGDPAPEPKVRGRARRGLVSSTLFRTVYKIPAKREGGKGGADVFFFACFPLTPSRRGSSYWEPSWSRSPAIGVTAVTVRNGGVGGCAVGRGLSGACMSGFHFSLPKVQFTCSRHMLVVVWSTPVRTSS